MWRSVQVAMVTVCYSKICLSVEVCFFSTCLIGVLEGHRRPGVGVASVLAVPLPPPENWGLHAWTFGLQIWCLIRLNLVWRSLESKPGDRIVVLTWKHVWRLKSTFGLVFAGSSEARSHLLSLDLHFNDQPFRRDGGFLWAPSLNTEPEEQTQKHSLTLH